MDGTFRTGTQASPAADAGPELADVSRLARRLVRRAVRAARAEDDAIRRRILEHLGADADRAPVVSGSWPSYDHVNVQAGLNAWLAAEGHQHELEGLAGVRYRHMMFGLNDLMQPGMHMGPLGLGGVAYTAREAGPGGEVLPLSLIHI